VSNLVTCSYRRWAPALGQPVVISLLVPKWIDGAQDWPRCWEITPRWSYFHASEGAFEDSYLSQVEDYGIKRIARRLGQIARETGADRLVLLCWEWAGPGGGRDRCHRGLWAQWWLESTGELTEEVTPITEKENQS
jgi:hypothetical protein